MFHYKVTSLPNFDIDNNILDKIFKNVSNSLSIAQKGTLNIVFMDENSIQKLNNNYRKKDAPTDVLSFHYYEDFSKLSQDDVAGEIILCEPYIISQGKEFGLGTQKEFYKLIIHSTLHVLGYDHETDEEYKDMSFLEREIWGKVFEK